MNCEICGVKDVDLSILLPIKKEDGSLNTMACLKCAEESDAYCMDHERPHTGFSDSDETACLACVEQAVFRNRFDAAGIFAKIRKSLNPDHLNRLQEWARVLSEAIDDTLEACVLRALTTKAVRLDIDIDEMVAQVAESHSIDQILPETVFA